MAADMHAYKFFIFADVSMQCDAHTLNVYVTEINCKYMGSQYA